MRALLNSLFFFYKKISHAPKSTKKYQNHKKHKKAQKRNQAKVQNATSKQK